MTSKSYFWEFTKDHIWILIFGFIVALISYMLGQSNGWDEAMYQCTQHFRSIGWLP